MSKQLCAPYPPAGDQPKAIQALVEHIHQGVDKQLLLGVTGSGKTFTIASTLAKIDRPALVVSHNKTLAAQLYSELKGFFPGHAVEYFVSYYDYYQPEVYLPTTGQYIEKELLINDELEQMRLSTIASLVSNRQDVIVVASVSCIYGLGKPDLFREQVHCFQTGTLFPQKKLLHTLVQMGYTREDERWKRGHFRVMGDSVDLCLAYAQAGYRFVFFGQELEAIYSLNGSGNQVDTLQEATVFPANLFMIGKGELAQVMAAIRKDLTKQVDYFRSVDKIEEAERLEQRTRLDLEMLQELGYCSGIENYARYIDGRSAGERPFCLLDYFPKDYLLVIDESHVTIPQFRAMWGGDRARKTNLVDYGFRLPAAIDNRPLSFMEFEQMMGQTIFVTATPAEYELEATQGMVVEQIIRPTGLVDPTITIRPTRNQIGDILAEIHQAIEKNEKILITTLTKKMAEELAAYLGDASIRCRYMHCQIKTLDRVAILDDLRADCFDVLVGVNLLREGLDLPQAALMIILDADKEGFLRNTRSLIQTIGRVARHPQGRVLMYADQRTPSMQQAIEETARRRRQQLAHNQKYQIIPGSLPTACKAMAMKKKTETQLHQENPSLPLEVQIKVVEEKMYQAADALRFTEADALKERWLVLRKKHEARSKR